jgi:YHS domain-containing protein
MRPLRATDRAQGTLARAIAVTSAALRQLKDRMRSYRFIACLSIILLAIAPLPRVSGAEAVPVDPVNKRDGIALKGYDPVAYFTSGRPTEGSAQYSMEWKGGIYRFSSPENLAAFRENPEKYAPQYGGYCAYAMSLDRIADIDPTKWAIIDGRLYLNNGFIAQSLWSFDKPGNIRKADDNWSRYPKLAEGVQVKHE